MASEQESQWFDWLAARWDAAERQPCANRRLDLGDVVNWVRYCLTYKPIPMRAFDAMVTDAERGIVPAPRYAIGPVEACKALPDGGFKGQLLEFAARMELSGAANG